MKVFKATVEETRSDAAAAHKVVMIKRRIVIAARKVA